MPPRPFPFALRVGNDIISISRIRQSMTRPRKDQRSQLQPLLDKLLTRREQQIFRRSFPQFTISDTDRLPRVAEHIAGRWAAKEAAIKAVKPRKLVLLDVEVLRQGETGELYGLIRDDTFLHNGVRRVKLDAAETTAEEGAPAAAADTKASADAVSPVRKEAAVEESDHDPAGQIVAISISHDSEYATAVCIAPLGSMPGDVGGEAAARMYDANEEDADFWKQ